jgi:hypothetical protein
VDCRKKVRQLNLGSAAQRHLGMIGSQFTEEQVEGNRLRALGGELTGQQSVDLAGPIETEAESKAAVVDCRNTLITDKDEAEIGGCGVWEMEAAPDSQVIGDALKPFKKLRLQNSRQGNQADDPQSEQ